MVLLCVPGTCWSKRVNPGSVFELAFLMGNIEEPAFILLDVQQYALSKVILSVIHHLLFAFMICETTTCTMLKIGLQFFYAIFISAYLLVFDLREVKRKENRHVSVDGEFGRTANFLWE